MPRSTALTPANATTKIRKLASKERTTWILQLHFKDRLYERSLIISDIRYLLKFGFVYDKPAESTQTGFWKYKIQGKTPNSDNRTVGALIIPDFDNHMIKFITIYWQDEPGIWSNASSN